MPYISQSFVGDQALQLGNEEFVRTMSFGANWRKVRIGIYYSIYCNVDALNNVAMAANAALWLGLCQGSGGGFTNPVPTDAVAFNINYGNYVLQYHSTPPGYYGFGFNPGRMTWKYGPAVTNVNQSTSLGTNSAAGTYRYSMYVDYSLSAGPPSATMGVTNWQDTSAPSGDQSRTVFLTNMQAENSMTGLIPIIGTGFTYTGNFKLDSVCVYWNRCMPVFLLSEVCVTRFY
jgi:hypothetical protein